jgi:hypothetical protein
MPFFASDLLILILSMIQLIVSCGTEMKLLLLLFGTKVNALDEDFGYY